MRHCFICSFFGGDIVLLLSIKVLLNVCFIFLNSNITCFIHVYLSPPLTLVYLYLMLALLSVYNVC